MILEYLQRIPFLYSLILTKISFTHTKGFAIEGPSQAKIECDDQSDGSCDVKYWPKEPGEYAVHVMCDDEDIKNSPYMAYIQPASGDFNPDQVITLSTTGI